MKKIGYKSKIHFIEGYADENQFRPTQFQTGVEDWFVSDLMYLKLMAFTDPALIVPDVDTYSELYMSNGTEKVRNALALNPNGTPVWPYEAVGGELRVAHLGHCDFIVPDRWDNLRALVLRTICRVLNWTLYFKQRSERARWHRILRRAAEHVG
jgi:hypothetical protein